MLPIPPGPRRYRARLAAGLLAAAVLSCPAAAADSDGNFAYKGAGAQTCGAFRASWQDGSRDLSLYGGWIDGYLTAYNQSQPETFDIAPWQTTQTLLGLTRSVCAQLPEDTAFTQAVWQLVQALQPMRLDRLSKAVVLTDGESQTAIYTALLPRVLARLSAEGLSPGEPQDTEFPDRLAASLTSYQERHGLDPSGRLDQRTLFTLLATSS